MSPEAVPDEWVQKAARSVAGVQPACDDCGENGPVACVYCKDEAEKYARYALAAVLPEIQAQAQNAITEVFEIVDRHTNRRLEERVYLTSNEALNHASTWDPIDQRVARVQSVARLATTEDPT